MNKHPAWDDLRVLLEVHRKGSFLGAARVLGWSTSTVSRRVGALEQNVGKTLVTRSAQGVSLEREGLELISLAEAFEVSLAAHQRDRVGGGSPFAGIVRVSLPDGFLRPATQVAVALQMAHPETEIELMRENQFVDLAAREADIGIRFGRSLSAVLVERSLGAIQVAPFASAAYLKSNLPHRLLTREDYRQQKFIVDETTTNKGGGTQWLLERGAQYFPFRSNALEARILAAQLGKGVVMMGVGMAQMYPQLLRIGLERPLAPLHPYLVMHCDLQKERRFGEVATGIVQMFADYATVEMAAEAQFLESSGKW